MTDLELKIQEELGLYVVERKFEVIHYESGWPPSTQRESTTSPEKRCRYISDLLNKKIINSLRNDITLKTFETMKSIKDYVLKYVSLRITKEDFGEMADVTPEVDFKVGKGKRFYSYSFHWYNTKDDKKSTIDPWFAIRITKRE